jgi:Zn finger protein HypA/HybF involved in hydrogenase expression
MVQFGELKLQKYTNEQVFSENSLYPRNKLKARIINQKLIEYKCTECDNIGIHNGKLLSLQLDHINGKSEDNRLENLRFLCPNCHSQTDTYAGKGSKGKRNYIKQPKTKNFYERKFEEDKILWERVKLDTSIRFGEWGWKSRACNKLGIKSQKVAPWLRRIDPDFLLQYE